MQAPPSQQPGQGQYQIPPQQQQQQPPPQQSAAYGVPGGFAPQAAAPVVQKAAPMVPAGDEMWFYLDQEDRAQGPFKTDDMRQWFGRGFFQMNLQLRLASSQTYRLLSEVFPNTSVAFTPEATAAAKAQQQQPPQQQQYPPGQAIPQHIQQQQPPQQQQQPPPQQQQQQQPKAEDLTCDFTEYTAQNGKKYWHSKKNNQSTWDEPEEHKMYKAKMAAAATPTQPSAPVQEKKEVPLTCDWTEYTAGNDKKYYHNKKTNQSVWEEPEDFKLYKAYQAGAAANASASSGERDAKRQRYGQMY